MMRLKCITPTRQVFPTGQKPRIVCAIDRTTKRVDTLYCGASLPPCVGDLGMNWQSKRGPVFIGWVALRVRTVPIVQATASSQKEDRRGWR